MIHAGMIIETRPAELQVAIAWMHAAQASGFYSKYAGFWNDTNHKQNIINNITQHQFGNLAHTYGRDIVVGLLDYFVCTEDYMKCAAIVKQIGSCNTVAGETTNSK